MLQLKVTDGSENVSFTVIGHNAGKMLKYTVEEHIEYEGNVKRCT